VGEENWQILFLRMRVYERPESVKNYFCLLQQKLQAIQKYIFIINILQAKCSAYTSVSTW